MHTSLTSDLDCPRHNKRNRIGVSTSHWHVGLANPLSTAAEWHRKNDRGDRIYLSSRDSVYRFVHRTLREELKYFALQADSSFNIASKKERKKKRRRRRRKKSSDLPEDPPTIGWTLPSGEVAREGRVM